MLHNTKLSSNHPGEKFKDIEKKIDAIKTNEGMANIIAQYRKEIMDVLGTEEAEGDKDKKTLNGLIKKLDDKKKLLETNLGKTPPCKIDLSDNTAITDFWKKIIDNSDPKLAGTAATPTEKKNINDRITEALEKIQFVHDDSKGDVDKIFQLFKGGSTEITDIAKTTSDPLIKQLLNEKDPTKIGTTIDEFINSVKSSKGKSGGGNPFFISTSKLDGKGDKICKERSVALRVVLYLYCIHRITNPVKGDKFKLTTAMYNDIDNTLKRLMDNEIPKIKGLHNAEVELGYIKPEYETLEELEKKKGDIDQGTHNLGTTTLSFPINLTSEYESGAAITKDIDEYRVIEKDIKITDAGGTTYKAYLIDKFGKTDDLFAKLAGSNPPSVDFCIEVSGQKVKLGELTLSNVSGNAQLKIDIDDETTIKTAFNKAGVTMPSGQLAFEIPVKGIKNVIKGVPGAKAALTKKVKISLTSTGTPLPSGSIDVEASLSNVTEISREEAERVAEEKLRERYENRSRWNPDRINIFLRRDYIKERYVRKIMESEKGMSRKDRDMDATDRQQIQDSQDKIFDDEIQTIDLQTKCPNTYHEIDVICKQYMGTPPAFISTLTPDQFKKKFSDIVNHEPPHDNPSVLTYLGKERALTYSSNILFRMDMFIDHQKMVNNINSYIAAGHTDAEIEKYCRTEIKTYMDKYNNLPDFLKSTGVTLDDATNFVSKIKGSTGALTAIAAQTMNLKMKIIKKGSAAYKIKQDNGKIAKFGNWIDGGSEKRRKEMNPFLMETLGWTRGIVRTGTIVGLGVAGGMLFGPLGTALTTGATVGLRTLFSKYSHYTKEHEGQMKNEAVDRANYEAERSRLQSAVGGKKRYQINRLWGNDRKDARHRNRYVRTTHGRSQDTAKLGNDIKVIANKDSVLNAAEKTQLENLVAEGYARLKYYKEVGQNFLGSNDVNKAEGDYKELYSKLITGAKRLGWMDSSNPNKIDESQIQSNPNYTATMNSLKTGYTQANDRFKSKRRQLGIGGAVVTGAVAGGVSYLTTKIGWKKYGKGDEHNFVNPGDQSALDPMVNTEKGGGTQSLHDVFSNAMSSRSGATGYKLAVSPEIDAIPTGAGTSHTYSSLSSKIASIEATIPTSDTKTLEAFQKATELHTTMPPRYKRSALEKAIAYAANHGADTGNQYLYGERFVETISETLNARTSAGTTNIPIDKIVFGRHAANAAASVPGSSGNILERSMNGTLTIKGPGVGVPVSRNTFKRHEGNVTP